MELIERFKDVANTADLLQDIDCIIRQSHAYASQHVNYALVAERWLIGRRIMLHEQNGKDRAQYGKETLKSLSVELTKKYGKGYSEQSLYNSRLFYQKFSTAENFSTVWRNLTWSHYKLIMRIDNEQARIWYCNECALQNWDTRTLNRNIGTQYFERLLASKGDEQVVGEMKEQATENNVLEFVKDPYVLEFLGLDTNMSYKEKELEKALIDNLQQFLLELGKGFSFVDRQKLIRTETQDFYIDLVFYNYILKCFVIIDLKVGQITHQDIGQMEMYVNMYDEMMRREDDNPTIGLLLCSQTDRTIARYSVLNQAKQIFASKYITYLPTEEELSEQIQKQKFIFEQSLINNKQ